MNINNDILHTHLTLDTHVSYVPHLHEGYGIIGFDNLIIKAKMTRFFLEFQSEAGRKSQLSGNPISCQNKEDLNILNRVPRKGTLLQEYKQPK